MATPDELVRDLLEKWVGDDDRPGDGGPGLLARLDDLALRTAQPREAGGHASPGSRPPASLAAASLSVEIKSRARILDMELRGSIHIQSWDKALKAIPYGAEAAGRVREVASTLGRWHSSARTILGLQERPRPMIGVRCMVCDEVSIVARPDSEMPRAWCSNEACEDEETGRPAVYVGDRLYLLTQNRASA